MKKIMMIILASMALAACGDGSNRSEANRDDTENTNTQPSVYPDVEADDEDTTSINNDNNLDDNSMEDNNLNNDNSMDNNNLNNDNTMQSDSLDRDANF